MGLLFLLFFLTLATATQSYYRMVHYSDHGITDVPPLKKDQVVLLFDCEYPDDELRQSIARLSDRIISYELASDALTEKEIKNHEIRWRKLEKRKEKLNNQKRFFEYQAKLEKRCNAYLRFDPFENRTFCGFYEIDCSKGDVIENPCDALRKTFDMCSPTCAGYESQDEQEEEVKCDSFTVSKVILRTKK